MARPSFKSVLLLYKKSSYAMYFRYRVHSLQHLRSKAINVGRFKDTHRRHFQSLTDIEQALRREAVSYRKVSRGRNVDFSSYDLIITVGGDGTFLEAAGKVHGQHILGVNSDPKWSVGRFCSATYENFADVFSGILNGRFKVKQLHRLRFRFEGTDVQGNALNDMLVCHKNPAAMSRYYLQIGKIREEQRSSGVWVATAAGSSGALHSAGGTILPMTGTQFEYMPRELYLGRGQGYRLKGGVLAASGSVKVISLMKDGAVFVDGHHMKHPFPFGHSLTITRSREPLKVIDS